MLFARNNFIQRIKLAKQLREFSISCKDSYKVAVLGGAGQIGRNLGLILKLNPLITEVALQDVSPKVLEVAADINNINTHAKTLGYHGDKINHALYGANVVVIPAGFPRTPNLKNRDELFEKNADIMFNLATAIAKCCPKACVALVTNPINAGLPLISEVMAQHGVYDPRKLFGVTTLDVLRACAFVSELNGSDPVTQCVPVVGGHQEGCIIPLLSQSLPPIYLTDVQRDQLTTRIGYASKEVTDTKAGASATLSTAIAAARFVDSLLRGLNGEKDIIECAYVRSDITPVKFFANPLLLGPNGIETNLGIGNVSPYEKDLIDKTYTIIGKNIEKGLDYAKKKMLEEVKKE